MLGCVAVCFVLLNVKIICHVKQLFFLSAYVLIPLISNRHEVSRSRRQFLQITGQAKLRYDAYLHNKNAVAAHMFS